MRARPVLGLLVLGSCAASCMAAWAADAPAPVPATLAAPLPIFASTPQPEISPWAGLYVGTEIFGIGGKGLKGGFGGDAFAGYNREFSNNWVLGVQGSTGYAPSLYKTSVATGYEFATTTLKAGYDMGRLMPFVTASVGLAKPNVRTLGYTGALDTADTLLNDPRDLQAAGSVGAGVDYKITNNLSMELAVSATRGPAGAAWP